MTNLGTQDTLCHLIGRMQCWFCIRRPVKDCVEHSHKHGLVGLDLRRSSWSDLQFFAAGVLGVLVAA